ncbi:putative O-phosphotransferase [Streptomyces chrestomyceticus JCM 4735]|uniref:O-phosphotransferase n=1 Tax=Streptomyces chrestomyceticus JCM 4735 TaxID=1306181 RepID=A0A7U9L051_9ACTN|nr:chloramphenicol phosphotransferase CPT [Streptomyces chrestomyceticus]GCD37161.1 putative O-phosphotransferase [Streptomyces chrestomyceticus JCM 4735]
MTTGPPRTRTDVVVLNGGSSSGTSTLIRQLQDVLPRPWLTFGVDSFIEALPPSLVVPEASDTAPGLGLAPDGSITVGPVFRALQADWQEGVAAIARTGTGVLLDEVFLGGAEGQERWRRTLKGLSVLWVGVRCAPETAAAREAARGDRITGMAASQAELVHRGVTYDIEVDTGVTDPLTCARQIAAHVA